MPSDSQIVEHIRRASHPLTGLADEYDPVLQLIGDSSLVLLGEATHGTHEFYDARARITRRLIEEQGFTAVAVEADWPDAYRVNRFVHLLSDDRGPLEALADFTRFPLWMWRNTEMLRFIDWLRDRNADHPVEERAGFYGLDLYSLYSSIEAVIQYLERFDPAEAQRARERYACLDHVSNDPQHYGHGFATGARRSCREEVVEQLIELRRRAAAYLSHDGPLAEDEQFFAEQNARLVRNAEAYYRELFGSRVNTWNLRDRHMAETLAALRGHLGRRDRDARMVIWAHNSHLGDARATEMGMRGELNLGQLCRERYGRDAVLIGFTTHTGTVSAANHWDDIVHVKRVRPSLTNSYEWLLHQTGDERFILPLRNADLAEALHGPRLERAIGVIYLPQSERSSHYFFARLPEQFDAVIHFDTTQALEPIDHVHEWQKGPLPDTYPFAV